MTVTPRTLLLTGMAAGLLLALTGVVRAPGDTLPEDVIARVGSHDLLIADYRRTINSLQAERRKPLDPEMRAQVLERLVDEYLLLQHARDLNLSYEVPMLRKRTVAQVLEILRSQVEAMEPDDAELLRFLDGNRVYFGLDEEPGMAHLEAKRELVMREWRRRTAEDLLAALLQELRDRVPVQVREELP